MLKPLLFGAGGLLAVAVLTVLVLAARKPDVFRVSRSARIAVPPERIVPLLTDLRRWRDWSPYEKLDPEMQRTYGGAATGVGAAYEWEGNGNVGHGRMEITEATPSRVAFRLDFFRPFRCRNVADLTLEPDGDGTTVTWSMEGPSTFVSKVVGVFIDMDRMVGGQFEEGLANLKAVAEQRPETTAAASEPAASAVR